MKRVPSERKCFGGYFALLGVQVCVGAGGNLVISYLQSCFHGAIIYQINGEKDMDCFFSC